MKGRILAVLIAASAAFSASAQIAPFQAKFDQTLTEHGVIGGGFAFVHGQDAPVLHAFGRQKEDGAKVDAETAYNWASITKTFTAIAILQLRDHGKLSLDDSVTTYLPELRQVHNAYGPIDAITIRQLLSHSAGFRNPTWPWDCDDPESCDWQPFEPTKWEQLAAMLPYTHIGFAPGSRWSYSNPGFVFLGQVIERLTGDDFEVYVDKNILKPLEMTHSYFDRAPYFLEAHLSSSYLRAGAKLTPQPFNYDTGLTTSNSGLKAPIADMVKYLRFLIGDGKNPLYEVVLKRRSLEEMWTGLIPIEEKGPVATVYTALVEGAAPMMGMGFFTAAPNGHAYVYHDGDQGGFSSELLIDPAGRSAAILSVNTTDTGELAAQDALHAQSNTDPDPKTDLRLALRAALVETVFPRYAK